MGALQVAPTEYISDSLSLCILSYGAAQPFQPINVGSRHCRSDQCDFNRMQFSLTKMLQAHTGCSKETVPVLFLQ